VDVLDISRWQFGITTVYHFLFVPITIGLAFLVARHGRLSQRHPDGEHRPEEHREGTHRKVPVTKGAPAPAAG
jgi:Cytochrome bd terminal oxidase subunit I